jgi:hypothetical protein
VAFAKTSTRGPDTRLSLIRFHQLTARPSNALTMYRHLYFDLRLHDDDELAAVLRSKVVERITLHEWPLSCVQRLTTADGRQLIYKSQSGPTVEPEFYERARSDLLPAIETIHRSDAYACMLMEAIAGRRALDLGLSEAAAIEMGQTLLRQIACIGGEPPCFLDISSPDHWAAAMEEVLKDLRQLVARKSFKLVDESTARQIERWAFSGSVLSAMAARPGCVHGDLGGDNVFVVSDGYRVIDWQRPLRGPANLDLARWLESLGFDPFQCMAEEIVWAMYLLRIGWFAQCSVRWFPEGVPDYDRLIAHLAAKLGHSG